MAIANKVIHNPATGQTIRFHKTSRETDGALLEMESIFNPFSKEPPPHYHPFQKEHFIVLEGRIHMRVNGAVTELIKGEEIEIPANAIHSMWNPFTKKAGHEYGVPFGNRYGAGSKWPGREEGYPRIPSIDTSFEILQECLQVSKAILFYTKAPGYCFITCSLAGRL
jgi:quercetin dioxygenase-like cupin family protein